MKTKIDILVNISGYGFTDHAGATYYENNKSFT
jgi:hypothetical protein